MHNQIDEIAHLRGNVLAEDCPSRRILAHITSRWGGLVLLALGQEEGALRFSELKRRIGGISERMLAQTLQVLEADGLVKRHDHGEVPPRVDYRLTAAGREISARVMALSDWIETHLPELIGA